MQEVRSLNEINEDIIENYKSQIDIFKEMIASRDKLIILLESQLGIRDKYIEDVGEDIKNYLK